MTKLLFQNASKGHRSNWAKYASRLVGCSMKRVIGVGEGLDDVEIHHKNANAYQAKLWGGLLRQSQDTNILDSVNILLSAVLL